MSELEALKAIAEAAVVRPGDTLVLRCGADVSADALRRISEDVLPALKKRLPDVDIVIVGGAEQMVVHRPGEDDGT